MGGATREGQILLFSKDEELVKCLREVVAEGPGSEFGLEVNVPGPIPARNGLCIWDFVPGETALPQPAGRHQWRNYLFLLHRKDLAALRALLGVSDINVLLKPVTRSVLRAFLIGYCAHRADPSDGNAAGESTLRGERDDVLQILMHASLKLQEYRRERATFLARSVHDFRAPLTAISGYCELLLGNELEPLTAGQRTILQRMQHSARRLTRATNSMSRLSVAESAEPALNLEPADIRDCVGRALQDLSAVLENKQVSITVEVEPSPENLLFEKVQIEQALANLLESACKFTPRGGAIEIRGYPFFWERRSGLVTPFVEFPDRRNGEVRSVNSFRIDISDSGPAISAVDTERIFEEYASYSGGQDRSGAGLGMAICRMILSQHGGRVWAESSTQGAVFSFVLPLSRSNTFMPQVG